MSSDYPEAVQATVARLFKRQNKVVELEILLKAEASIDWYNQDWGVDYGRLHLTLPFEVFEQVLNSREDIEKAIADEINKFAGARNESFEVRLVPKLEVPTNWREKLNSVSDSAFGIPPVDKQYSTDVFVLMPFNNDDLDHVYRDHVTKVVTELGLLIKRGDDFFSQTSVIRDIWGAINAAEIIIADCTSRNPNVFYELGIAHTLGKQTIPITRNEADIPFDIRQWRYIAYTFTPPGMIKFERELREALQKLRKPPATTIDSLGDIPF